MEIKRSLEVGDTIVVRGIKATIKEIISQDAYIPSGESGYCIDIEFRDTKGKYRNWKSYIDKGTVIYKKEDVNILKEATNSVLGNYYDPYCGRFGIPLKEVDAEKSDVIISLLRSGFAMSIYKDYGGEISYVIYELAEDTAGYSNINKCKDLLASIIQRFNCKYFSKVSFDNYNESIQSIIDTVLLESSYFVNQVDGYSIALVCEGDYFKFIEVLDACV